MNTQLSTFTKDELSNEFKLTELATIYNKFANELDIKNIKKFSDKTSGIKRVLEIQEKYTALVKVKKVLGKTRGNFTLETRFANTDKTAKEGTGMHILQECVKDCGGFEDDTQEYCDPTAQEIMSVFKIRFKQPRGKAKIDIPYMRGALCHALRQGYIEIV